MTCSTTTRLAPHVWIVSHPTTWFPSIKVSHVPKALPIYLTPLPVLQRRLGERKLPKFCGGKFCEWLQSRNSGNWGV
ncbi:MAG: hypothetical protein ACOYMN_26195 [Roseimicrobium sp.]|jgi:hypothetical protein